MWGRWLRALAVLSGTVLIHELAHALVAWRVGGRVQEIAVGFGPRLLARRINGTTLSLRPLLVGGFAAIDVEDLPPERRVPVLLAGPFANLLLGLLLLPPRITPETVNSLAGPRACNSPAWSAPRRCCCGPPILPRCAFWRRRLTSAWGWPTCCR